MNFENLHVIFFQVSSAKQKIDKILAVANFHFQKNEKLLFRVADETAQKFLDELLWKEPSHSFLYHVVTNVPCEDLIVISKEMANLNGTTHVFNLLPSALLLEEPCHVIYDFDDNSNGKNEASKMKFAAYKENGCRIESR